MIAKLSYVNAYVRKRVLKRLLSERVKASEAEDAIQEACLRFLLVPPDIKDEAHIIAWLLTVAKHSLANLHRHKEQQVCISLDVIGEASSVFSIEHIIDSLLIEEALGSLSKSDQTMLQLKAEGWECKEIAEQQKQSEETVKKRLQRARHRFLKNLQDRELDPSH